MTKSRSEIQHASDLKRNVKVKGFKLKLDDIAYIEDVAKRHNLSHNELLIQAIQFFDENKRVN
ncbi:hypothetical protein [Acinetobacter larvae]|uniref:Ribbon-helix-helix protein, CopG family n=1 Tax=Acinetobacter larvae TaxID=1789224 RepID=A0A1B2LZE5_9GAMM|nr:hypothetical protein [Acinetobacter larvae]AOA58320.1 hypothetical protein BFG52_08100 [Acinetobacter larvae]